MGWWLWGGCREIGEAFCTPAELETLQRTCLDYGGSFDGGGDLGGLVDCSGDVRNGLDCKLRGAGQCAIGCAIERREGIVGRWEQPFANGLTNTLDVGSDLQGRAVVYFLYDSEEVYVLDFDVAALDLGLAEYVLEFETQEEEFEAWNFDADCLIEVDELTCEARGELWSGYDFHWVAID